MKVLLATTNPAKIKKYKNLLESNGLEVLTVNDLDFKLEVSENGANAIENAIIKAKAYYEKVKIPTIGMDDVLDIEGIPMHLEPKTHVRRIKGKVLTDAEMLSYYSKLIKKYGGKLKAKWIYGLAIYSNCNLKTYTWNKDDFYLLAEASSKINQGYPLDSLTFVPKYNKYLVELTEEEKNDDDIKHVIDFILENLK